LNCNQYSLTVDKEAGQLQQSAKELNSNDYFIVNCKKKIKNCSLLPVRPKSKAGVCLSTLLQKIGDVAVLHCPIQPDIIFF